MRASTRLAAAAAAGLLCALAAVPTASAADGPCPNAKYRTGPSLRLPDCRAYELVTPVVKVDDIQTWPTASASVGAASQYVALDGESLVFAVGAGSVAPDRTMGLVGGIDRARRGEHGWTVGRTTSAPVAPYVDPLATPQRFAVFSDDLSRIFFSSGTPFSPEQLPWVHPGRHGNVTLSDGNSAIWVSKPTWDGALPAQGTADAAGGVWITIGGSPSLDTVYFMSGATHTPEDGESGRIPRSSWATYVWKDGALSNAGVLPDGSVSRGGSIPANYSPSAPPTTPNGTDVEPEVYNAVSEDGKSFLFVSPDPRHTPADPTLPKPQLYMYREGEPTRLLSRGHRDGDSATEPVVGTDGVRPTGTAGDVTGPAYAVATADHSVVLFSTVDALTDDAPTDEPTTIKVYRYDAAEDELTYLPELDHPIGR